ncbi:aldehyde dehydrogenase family protein [Ancylobacter polymorphus]|jgi:acyl-CoA reductase-like NAD-dependent aldehyde dehydrogenase|uniref:Acyl-CoA reductase-like NAD-dependent aldehyde dehydrogenase n=1 Tax=Ancylobacter polymorphus TaxID=223390 RepID=A0ABU0BGK2_9HYPH|nr:aldehyde dehydrogenase family protein [Ancylobacter polymorphus]MDQ0304962.1 acyl-CoA reductase-like NAD-dependent aldehyde dehydrogenase [Ancylobacter polymorphus]
MRARAIEALSTSMLIDGQLTDSVDGKLLESINPANEEVIGHCPAATPGDVNRAVEAAERAFPAWAATSVRSRGQVVRQIAARMRERADEILHLEVRDTGNTIAKMRRDVESAANALDYYAGLGTELKGETVPASAEHLHLTLHEPYGVVGRIVPFNHPIKFAANALAAPLMAGNAVVLKTPEQSPLSAGILAQICRDVVPAGVVNILSGNGHPVGDTLVRHPRVKRIGFTGSVPTGLAIQKAAAETAVKAVSLELGGKNPLIAFPDVDPQVIADAAVSAMNFAWQGQSCGSMSRLLLHESVYETVVDRVVAKVRALRLGDPLDPASDMGPLNSRAHYERVCGMVAAGVEEGARLLTGGRRPKGAAFERGYWLEPTVFDEVDPSMTIGREEIFGPVLSIFRWNTEEEAVRLANSTRYGLAAAIWTNDHAAALRMLRAVRAGYIWVNGTSGHFYGTPFGGFGNSGIGREEGLGELLSYTEIKTVHLMSMKTTSSHSKIS